jgi:hypothetical protein
MPRRRVQAIAARVAVDATRALSTTTSGCHGGAVNVGGGVVATATKVGAREAARGGDARRLANGKESGRRFATTTAATTTVSLPHHGGFAASGARCGYATVTAPDEETETETSSSGPEEEEDSEEREDDDDDDDESAGVKKAKKTRKVKEPFVVPDEVPHDPPMLRSALVMNQSDAELACVETCADAVRLATERVESGKYPPSSRAMRIIATKIASKEDVKTVLDLMAKMHAIRVAKYSEDKQVRQHWLDVVFLDLYDKMNELDDFDTALWMTENIYLLGGKPTARLMKQAYYCVYRAPFETTYKLYDATREAYGLHSFATASVIGSAFNYNLFDLAMEYTRTFVESGAVLPPKVFLRVLSESVKRGDVASGSYGRDGYLASVKDATFARVKRAEEINAAIDAGTRVGDKIEIDPALTLDPKPQTPFYYLAAAKLALLQRDASAAAKEIDTMDGFTHVRDASSAEDACIKFMFDWPRELYVESGFTAIDRDELRASLTQALSLVTRDDLKLVLNRLDIDAAFAAAAEQSNDGAEEDTKEEDVSDESSSS